MPRTEPCTPVRGPWVSWHHETPAAFSHLQAPGWGQGEGVNRGPDLGVLTHPGLLVVKGARRTDGPQLPPHQGHMSTVPYTEKGLEAQGGDPPGQVISWMGGAGRCLLLAGRNWLGTSAFPVTCHPPTPGLTPPHTPPAPSPRGSSSLSPPMCAGSISGLGTSLTWGWVQTSACLCPRPGHLLPGRFSALGTALQGQLLQLRPRLPESSDAWGR